MKNTICPNCQSNLESEFDISGLNIECPICKTTFTVKKDKKPQFIVNKKITNHTNFNNSSVINNIQNNTTNRMFCRTCGTEVFNNAEICISCGCFLNSGSIVYCPNCGSKKQHNNTVVCVHCGYSFIDFMKQTPNDNAKQKWIVAFLLCLFLGYWGAHRFYAGKIGTGITLVCFNFINIISYILFILFQTNIGDDAGILFFYVSICLSFISGIWVFIDFICLLCGIFKTNDGKVITYSK